MTIDLEKLEPVLEALLRRAAIRYTDQHPKQPVACLALLVNVIGGEITVCIEQRNAKRGDGWKPCVEFDLPDWETLDLPQWRDAYEADTVTLSLKDGSQIKVSTMQENEAYAEPFFNVLYDHVSRLLNRGVLQDLPAKKSFTFRVEDIDGGWDREWKKNARNQFSVAEAFDWDRYEQEYEALKENRDFNGKKRRCPKCGTEFTSVQNRGNCPGCQLFFFASHPDFEIR